MGLETWELLSYVVTVFALPFAIGIFMYEQRRERENEDEEVYQLLSDNYQDFLKTALENTDLSLFSKAPTPDLTAEQRERKLIIFDMLVSLFERAYLLLYDDSMTGKQSRRWRSWEDYMGEWCARNDFRNGNAEAKPGQGEHRRPRVELAPDRQIARHAPHAVQRGDGLEHMRRSAPRCAGVIKARPGPDRLRRRAGDPFLFGELVHHERA